MFIVLEGPDGAGKSTLAEKLVCDLRSKGRFSEVLLASPFSTDYGKLAKTLLNYSEIPLAKCGKDIDFKYRQQIMANVLQVASHHYRHYFQNPNNLVVMDRWIPSFYAYQKPFVDLDCADFFCKYFDYEQGNALTPDISIYLLPETEILINRIGRRKDSDALDQFFLENIKEIIHNYRSYIGLYHQCSTKSCYLLTSQIGDELFSKVTNWLYGQTTFFPPLL